MDWPAPDDLAFAGWRFSVACSATAVDLGRRGWTGKVRSFQGLRLKEDWKLHGKWTGLGTHIQCTAWEWKRRQTTCLTAIRNLQPSLARIALEATNRTLSRRLAAELACWIPLHLYPKCFLPVFGRPCCKTLVMPTAPFPPGQPSYSIVLYFAHPN